ncbi:hypothetical protein PAHAL_1G058700 [Panicum hallii]|uniref:Uncharacterized protein n=1 Tax=Panicum hallii TaxID=206008 RepID=A0A2T8KU93_9POAL|nr:hypothetical protein PAHAL_1G058700 [Panicum hallii]
MHAPCPMSREARGVPRNVQRKGHGVSEASREVKIAAQVRGRGAVTANVSRSSGPPLLML